MTSVVISHDKSILHKLLLPFIISIILGCVIFYGNDAYQIMGLAALESTIVVFGYVLGIAEFLVLALLIQRIVQLLILDRFIAKALGSPTPRLLSQLSAIIIYTIAIAAIVGVIFKKDLTVVLATFGGASIVIGLALQGIIRDLFAGLTINLDRSINIGDFISVKKSDNFEGVVQEISWRTTHIVTLQGNLVIIPNSLMSAGVITNYSSPNNYMEQSISVFLAIDMPVNKVLRILLSAVQEASLQFSPTQAPAPKVVLRAITLQGVEYGVVYYPTFKSRTAGRHAVHQHCLKHLTFAGLSPLVELIAPEIKHTIHSITHLSQLLSGVELFADFTAPELEVLATAAKLVHLPAHAAVTEGGEMAEFMCLIIEGLVFANTWRQQGNQKPAEASTCLGPGELINSVAFLAGAVCETSIHTQTEALILIMNYHSIEQLFSTYPTLSNTLSLCIAQQIYHALQQGKATYYLSAHTQDIPSLTAMVLKNLRRTFAHLQLA